jgi:hypothetical protein
MRPKTLLNLYSGCFFSAFAPILGIMNASRYLPIGIQDFEDLRRKGFLYVDKTAFVWKLASEGKPYFLSRPRRFGKSLPLPR